MRGWRGRIGFLWPHDGHTDDEYWAYLPEGTSLLVARYAVPGDSGGLSLAELARWAEPELLARAAGLLRLARPDVVAMGDHAASFVMGAGRDAALLAAIADATGVPATSPATAIRAALRALAVSRIALTSPYPSEVTARLVADLEATGLAVVASRCLDLAAETGIGELSPGFWHRLAREASRTDAEAVLLAGGGIRTAGALGLIERDLGKPVLSAPAALIWHACRLAGIAPEDPRQGCLYRLPASSAAP